MIYHKDCGGIIEYHEREFCTIAYNANVHDGVIVIDDESKECDDSDTEMIGFVCLECGEEWEDDPPIDEITDRILEELL